ncbi:hypothetical protein S7711_10190 [Stachybotrys chartarum IBT 7711]|uniref:Uncharacterized protein n=1 Tax=Stachybotrys chartarum (strain CBS 109288 / IBT 7711) TaxID=1280523 RepID=A0A084B5Y7_STACB|nr:hypothetical protein S7711_10190 [Stachybotrys chartarum IBT 7711]
MAMLYKQLHMEAMTRLSSYSASYGGRDKIVELLLDKGANVNAEGGKYGNALYAASSEGHDKIVELLLDKGANVNAEGGKYGNALYAASSEGHDKIVELLLDKGANVNAYIGWRVIQMRPLASRRYL